MTTTNKRQLKKRVQNICGELATEILIARRAFTGFDDDVVDGIVTDIARLQDKTIRNISFSFDKSVNDFDNKQLYNKALAAYHKAAYSKLSSDFDKDVKDIVKRMNEAMPESVREAFKEAVK